ncbi:response regulator [Candidatus Bathyarchaeota archaeon]|nr:response regulator [Candidatus Bathyarchaeota archaeon]
MSFTERIDVLDLIINVLNEHEKKLDDIVQRLEIIVDIMEGHPDFSEVMHSYQEQAEVLPGSSGTVLVVDDDEFLTETFRMLLVDAGFDVETAGTGNQALLKASQTDFDLAILDLKLPDTTGNELAKRLKARNKDINVILLTGQTEMLENIDPADLGTDEVLFKPISPDELLKITEKLRSRA